MLAIQSFKIFDLVQVMTDGGPGTSTYVISYFIYQKTLGLNSTGEFGYASAASLILFFICLTFTIVQFIVNQQADLVKPKWATVPIILGLLFFAMAVWGFCTQQTLLIGWGWYLILFLGCFVFTIVQTNLLRRKQQ